MGLFPMPEEGLGWSAVGTLPVHAILALPTHQRQEEAGTNHTAPSAKPTARMASGCSPKLRMAVLSDTNTYSTSGLLPDPSSS